MQYKTLLQLRTKIENDLDLQDELFITASQLNDIINEAIDDAEAEIHNTYQDYFLKVGNIALVSGTATYSLPSDIYMNKIRHISYTNGAIKYEIKRMREMHGFMDQLYADQYPSTADEYMYRLINQGASTGVQIRLFPPAQETSSTNVEIWYLRNAATLSADTDVCDIPEFYTYIVQNAKCRCYEKEPGHPNYPAALQERERLKQLMISTLETMIPDNDNKIEIDYSHYEEHS